jgi:type IV secretion system protein TrbH
MRHAACALLCAVGLAGCLATPAPYGNFVQDAPAGYDRTVAEDAARQLAAVYPPANTRFELQQATPDAFGQLLTTSLRAKSYAVQEFTPSLAAHGGAARKEGGVASGPASTTRAAPVFPLRYVLDRAADLDLYRVTLLVGEQSLARAYVAQNGAVHPAGAWVRREAQP